MGIIEHRGIYEEFCKKTPDILLSVVLLADMPGGTYAKESAAKSMKLSQIEGTVSVTNGVGKKLPAFAEMKLSNGYHIDTARASYAWINLDDAKTAKMNECSNVDISEQNDDLELRLNSGDILVSVTEKIPRNATMKIRTGTTVTGITGTLVGFSVIDENHSRALMLEGSAESRITDPIFGQTKTATLRSGQVADFYTYGTSHEGDKCDIVIRALTHEDISGYIAMEIARDPSMALRIKAANLGLDVDAIVQNAPGLQLLSRQAIDAAIQEARTEETVTKAVHPLFEDPKPVESSHHSHHHRHHHDDDDSSSSASNTSGGNNNSGTGGNQGGGSTTCPVTGGAHNWTDHDNYVGAAPPFQGAVYTVQVTCQSCHATETHEVEITATNNKFAGFGWTCHTCNDNNLPWP
ncbi:MAG: hypothetical protein E7300_00275 [Lachnospiraceae bacterium]|nr:hypothetical protein [Lachnospiraceae bacterium]